ncbi:Protein white [Zootermopsis nevadensis]|uniref:Protein white n=1 Tax=Zootermopsis nevadensis TaxID=136037 RepID=A0A067RAU0_ZOONE|nr:Protein white [Zootermopsis nevadensis]
MTLSEEAEHESLLDSNSKYQKSSYNSVTYEREPKCSHDKGCESVICMNSLPSNGGDANVSNPLGIPGVAIDQMAYTWRNINVQTSGLKLRRRGIWCRRGGSTADQHGKQILKDVSGIARPGELLAIMGSSGAGKTTLLNTLMFRSPPNLQVSGQRALNGIPVSSSTLTSLSAYVQQDDLFVGTLTVREHLVFQALVRMDRNIPYRNRMSRVEEVISELALNRCQHTVIGVPGRIKGISGGEMKRLSFASEVLTNPPLMFCDEPTSGLDSFMAQNVVLVLKNMALKSKTVVVTIHQPSSEIFAMFDKVLLMADGRVAFLGSSDDACNFFRELGAVCPSNYNPADFFIQMLAVVPTREETSRQTIDMVCDAFQTSEAGRRIIAEAGEVSGGLSGAGGSKSFSQVVDHQRSPYKASWWAQLRAVLWRSWISIIKEPLLIKVRILQTLMVSVVIGVIYYGQELNQDGVININGALFIFLTNMTFQNVFAVINVFCAEMPVFLREHFNGMYRVDVYFLCKTLAEVPVFAALPIMFTCITYYLVGLNPSFLRFFVANIVVTLVANVAVSLGYLISCVSTSVSMAMAIGPPVIIPFLLFGGFFLNSSSVPAYFKWLSYLSWFKYGHEALLINQWSDVQHIECTHSNTTCPRNGLVVLEALNFKKEHFLPDLVSLVSLILIFRLFAFFALLWKTFRKE